MAQTKTTTSMYISHEVMEIVGKYVAATHRKRSQVIEILIALGHETPEAKAMLAQKLPSSYRPTERAPRAASKPYKPRATKEKPIVRKKDGGINKPVTVEVVQEEKPKPRVRRASNA